MTPATKVAVQWGAVILVALLAAGCVSSDTGRTGSQKDAARANTQLGVAYMQQGNLALAKEKLERAEQQDSRNVELQTALAFLNERLNQPEIAERHYRTAQRLSPDNAQVSNNYAVFLCRAGRIDAALELFDTAAKDPLYGTPWAALTNSAVCLRSGKRSAEAVPLLERALAMRPNYAEAVLELSDAQLELGHPDLATRAVDRYLSMGLSTPEILLVAVRAAIARGDKVATDNFARRLRRDYPNSAQTRALPQLLREQG